MTKLSDPGSTREVMTKRKKRRAKRHARRERTIAIITGLRAGDPAVLAPQPCMLANVAYDLGRIDRRTFLIEAQKVLRTKQIVGRLFSFHKQQLIGGKFVRFEKMPRSKWRAELEAAKLNESNDAKPSLVSDAPLVTVHDPRFQAMPHFGNLP